MFVLAILGQKQAKDINSDHAEQKTKPFKYASLACKIELFPKYFPDLVLEQTNVAERKK